MVDGLAGRSAAQQRPEEIVVPDLSTFERNLDSLNLCVSTACNAQRRARLERPEHLQGVDPQRQSYLPGRIPAGHRHTL